jgi:hypothetical protein
MGLLNLIVNLLSSSLAGSSVFAASSEQIVDNVNQLETLQSATKTDSLAFVADSLQIQSAQANTEWVYSISMIAIGIISIYMLFKIRK